MPYSFTMCLSGFLYFAGMRSCTGSYDYVDREKRERERESTEHKWFYVVSPTASVRVTRTTGVSSIRAFSDVTSVCSTDLTTAG